MSATDKEPVDLEGSDTGIGYTEENAVHQRDFIAGNGLYARIQRFAGKMGVEQRGIERVPADERTDTSLVRCGTMVSIQTVISYIMTDWLTCFSGFRPTW